MDSNLSIDHLLQQLGDANVEAPRRASIIQQIHIHRPDPVTSSKVIAALIQFMENQASMPHTGFNFLQQTVQEIRKIQPLLDHATSS
jgi:hypothetical protein